MVIEITIKVEPLVVKIGNPIFISGMVTENGIPVKKTIYFIRDEGINAGSTISHSDGYYDYNITIWEIRNHKIYAQANSYISPTATFEIVEQITYTINISVSKGGTTDPIPGNYTYQEGTIVNIIAIPYNGYSFDYWEINGSTYIENPISITIDKNINLKAYFKEELIPPKPPQIFKYFGLIAVAFIGLLILLKKK